MFAFSTLLKQGVNEMRTVDLKIEDIAFGGKGVARDNGKAVFVPFTIEGELVSATITREKKQFAEAEVVARCHPLGRVRVQGELWQARCDEGADVGDTVRIERIEGLTLIVAKKPA